MECLTIFAYFFLYYYYFCLYVLSSSNYFLCLGLLIRANVRKTLKFVQNCRIYPKLIYIRKTLKFARNCRIYPKLIFMFVYASNSGKIGHFYTFTFYGWSIHADWREDAEWELTWHQQAMLALQTSNEK